MLFGGGSETEVTAVERGSITCAWSYRDTEAGWMVVPRWKGEFPESAVRKVVPTPCSPDSRSFAPMAKRPAYHRPDQIGRTDSSRPARSAAPSG